MVPVLWRGGVSAASVRWQQKAGVVGVSEPAGGNDWFWCHMAIYAMSRVRPGGGGGAVLLHWARRGAGNGSHCYSYSLVVVAQASDNCYGSCAGHHFIPIGDNFHHDANIQVPANCSQGGGGWGC